MIDRFQWPFPNSFDGLWRLSSRFTIAAVGLLGKFVLRFMNKTDVNNKQVLIDAIEKRPPNVPLITVANHMSCFDDPGLWGLLPVRHLHPDVIRWSLTAQDICFTKPLHSQFFARGNCIPVVRGAGVYQKGLDFCIELLNKGRWIHVFPEGRVNMDKQFIRFKWGIGRLIVEAQVPPLIVPMWHCGMETVLPNVEPYRFKWGNYVLLNIGKPIDLVELMQTESYLKGDEEVKRKLITDRIQEELMVLKEQTEFLYSQLKP